MLVTFETAISDEATIAEFWSMYQTAFSPLATVAATKQTMAEHEFRSLMADEEVMKVVGWDRNGDPAAMMIVATKLSDVEWINVEFYEERFPEHAERGEIYYVLAALVRPTARGSLWFRAVLLELIKFCARRRAVCGIDCCQHNVDNVQIPRIARVLSESVAELESHVLDAQTFFAYEFHGMKGEVLAEPSVDLRDSIDLTDDTDRETAGEPTERQVAQRARR